MQVNYNHDGALMGEAMSKNSDQHNAAPHTDPGTVTNMLHWGMWVLTEPKACNYSGL
jgi:hypothetical protein